MSPRNKISLQHQNASQQRPFYGYSLGQLTSAPEAIYWSKSAPMYQSQGSWNSPVTEQAAVRSRRALQQQGLPDAAAAGQRADQIAYSDSGTGFSWGNYGNTYGHNASHNFNTRVRRVVRHRIARDQGRRHVHAPLGLDVVGRRQQRDDAAAAATACRAR